MLLKVNLHLVTVSISVRKAEPKSIAKRYENQMRIERLVEETKRKQDEHFYMFK